MTYISVGSVSFDGVSKRYRLGSLGTLRGVVASLGKRAPDDGDSRNLWALKDVSFRVEPGASLGLIGPNGAGKTTTLKLLSNITRPTEGHVEIKGRVSSLIELGAGFHPELSGRENIFLNGAILGLKRQEIRRRLDAIIAFSELERFIDTPVKRYSSGMYVRLGFAVAAHVEPDVLLVDEVLAVGDASFRSRCMERIRALQEDGTTVILVSHNMHQIRDVCDSALLLVNGQIAERGEPAEVIDRYEKLLTVAPATDASRSESRSDTASALGQPLALTALRVSPEEPSGTHLSARVAARARIEYFASKPLRIGRFHVAIYRSDHTLCCVADSAATSHRFPTELHGTGAVVVSFQPLQLTPGPHYAVVRVTDETDAEVIAARQSALFVVAPDSPGDHSGVYVPNVTWKIDGQPSRDPADGLDVSSRG